MSSQERMLIAHLARRAGFGATPDELDRYVATGYEALVEEFLNPSDSQHTPDDLIYRRFVNVHPNQGPLVKYWGYRMISTTCPLEEKIALLWKGVFATGYVKTNHGKALMNQIGMFRDYGLGRFDDLLVELSKDPAMLIWLDNCENHKEAINENYGREILELFSMGVGKLHGRRHQGVRPCVHRLDHSQCRIHGNDVPEGLDMAVRQAKPSFRVSCRRP